jgi:small subunit ribosomal protein S17
VSETSVNTTENETTIMERGRRKAMTGVVVSVKMDKTAVVAVERRRPHPLYHKIVRSTKRYKAHDPNNEAVLGDVVRIVETRPISKEKRWRIAQTLTRGNVAELAPRDIGVPEEALLQPEPPAAPEPTDAVSTDEVPTAEVSTEPVPAAEPEAREAVEAARGEAETESSAQAEPEASAEAEPEDSTEPEAEDEAKETGA